jgi:hypothetical protein
MKIIVVCHHCGNRCETEDNWDEKKICLNCDTLLPESTPHTDLTQPTIIEEEK